MIYGIRVWLWSIIAELEYHLYPWKDSKPPQWAIERHNVDASDYYMDYSDNLNYEWLKSHEEKISRLQTEMIWVQNEINLLKSNYEKNTI
jgi:hypothetical protein